MALKKGKNLGATRRYPKTAAAISAGDIVMLNSSGDALTAASSAGNRGGVGICVEDAAAADADVQVQEGEFLCSATSVTGQENVVAYGTDGDTVDESDAGNRPIVGVITSVESNTSCWVLMGAGVRKA